jgi:hypothetical protein
MTIMASFTLPIPTINQTRGTPTVDKRSPNGTRCLQLLHRSQTETLGSDFANQTVTKPFSIEQLSSAPSKR